MQRNRIIQNAKWIIFGKVAQAVIQFVIGMLSARYLGPSNYGVLNYATSVAAFALPVAQLGMRATLVQEYIENPEKEGQILGTSSVFCMISGLLCLIGVSSFAMLANRNETEVILVCTLYGIGLTLRAAELLHCWFQAKLLSKYSSLATLAAYLVLSGYRLCLLVTQKNIYWFALAHSFEYFALAVLLLTFYKKNGGQRLSFSLELGKKILAKSRYYILAELMVTAFQNTDHIMLQLMMGDTFNGYYTAAITCATVAGFAYNAILDSVRPVILESRMKSKEAFERNVSALYCVLTYLSLAQGVVFTLLADPIVRMIYGEAYLAAVPVLRINIWMLAFSHMGSARNIWILAEGKHSVLWIVNLSGVLANVLLNAVLIPLWGASGAAVASVLTQFVTNFVVGFVIKPLRENNRLLLKGLDPRCVRWLFVA